MAAYVFKRLFQGLIVVIGVTLIVFLIIHLIPGDPARTRLGIKATPAAVKRLDHELGLDKSLPAQYFTYLGNLLHGDLGTSLTQHTSVSSLIGPRVVPSLILVIYAIMLSLILAVPMAIFSALRRNRFPDHIVRALSVLMYSIPSFWLGLMLAVIFGLDLHIFPTSGLEQSFPGGYAKTLTLPAITVAFITTPVIVQVLRNSMVDALQSENVAAAHARGLDQRRVTRRYVLRSSLTASVTFIGISVATLLSFAVIVEQVFALPGLGSLLISSVFARDYPTVQGLTLVFGIVVVLANIAADISYGLLDPRVRL